MNRRKTKLGVLFVALCLWRATAMDAGAVPPGAAQQQLAAERSALQTLLADPNTPAERKAVAQELLEWNARGVTVAAFKAQQARSVAAPAAAATPQNNLMEAEAAPLPAQVGVQGGGSVLQNFSSRREADSSAKSAAALGLVKSQQDMEAAARESEAKLRDAQTLRDQAGAAALAQRQQDANNAAAQQAAGSMTRVLGDSLVQSVQQGAQAMGQAVGGAAGGRMSGAVGQLLPASGGGSASAAGATGGGAGDVVGSAMNSGASAAAGQIFGGGASAPAPTVTAGGDGASTAPAGTPAAAAPVVAADMGAMSVSGKRYIGPEPWQGRTGVRAPPEGAADRPVGHNAAQPIMAPANLAADAPAASQHRMQPQVRGLFDAMCPKHGKYGGEIGKVTGCPRCEAEKQQMWDAFCQAHGKYGGQGPVTGCPKCAEEAKRLLPRGGIR